MLRKAFAHGVATGVVLTSPIEQVKPPKHRKGVPAHWSPEEAKQFLALHEGDRLYPLWAFMLSSGVRVSELVWLRWPKRGPHRGIRQAQRVPDNYRLSPRYLVRQEPDRSSYDRPRNPAHRHLGTAG